MSASPYADTSALAKWYLNEPRSEDFEDFIGQQRSVAISRLVVVEFHCLLARRRRAGEFSSRIQGQIVERFHDHIGQGFLYVHPLEDGHAVSAVELLARLPQHPLRTLDALHLAIARDLRVDILATADRIMAGAAHALGFEVARFD